jgi:hypothetical protein
MASDGRRSYGRSAYGKLVLAQLILFFIGLLSIFVSAFGIRDAHEEVVELFDAAPAQVAPGMSSADRERQAEIQRELIHSVRVAHGIDLIVGVLFVACALLVHRMPVTATVTGLGLYIAMLAIVAAIEPALLSQGLPLRICIIIALSVAARSAVRSKRRRSRHNQRDTADAESD